MRAVALLGLLLVVVGCGERSEPLGESAPLYPVTVRGAGSEPLELAGRPETVVALDPGPAEILDAIGIQANLVEPDAAAAVEPDLVVATASGDASRAEAAAADSGAALYVQPDRSLREVRRAVLELGVLAGEPVRARRVAAGIRQAAAEVERTVGERRPVRVFVDTGFFVPPPEDSLLADLVRRAGGEDVLPAGESEPLDGCDVLALEPEVVLRVVEPDERPAEVGFRRCLAGLEDVRLVDLPASLVMRAGPRAGDALRAIARALHPNAFA